MGDRFWTAGWEPVDEKEAFEQLDFSVDSGVNFIDTAELYPVPAEAKTSGRTSEIIGKWLTQKKNRDKLVIATKIAGPGDYTKHIRTANKNDPFTSPTEIELLPGFQSNFFESSLPTLSRQEREHKSASRSDDGPRIFQLLRHL